MMLGLVLLLNQCVSFSGPHTFFQDLQLLPKGKRLSFPRHVGRFVVYISIRATTQTSQHWLRANFEHSTTRGTSSEAWERQPAFYSMPALDHFHSVHCTPLQLCYWLPSAVLPPHCKHENCPPAESPWPGAASSALCRRRSQLTQWSVISFF